MAFNPYSWSTTAVDNGTLLTGVNVAEGCNAGNLNNGIRSIMAGVKELLDLFGGAKTTGGSANAQTLTTGLSLTAYASGQLYGFEAGYTNTGATTLAVDGLTAKDVKRVDGSALSAGDITAGGKYLAIYRSSDGVIVLLNPTPASSATAVTAASTIADNTLVRGDGGSRGVQQSGITIDDTDNVTGIATVTLPNTGLHILDTNASHDLIVAPGSDLTADHTLTVTTGDADRTLTISGNATVSQDYSTTGNPQFATIELGAAIDTTLSRLAAGKPGVEGVYIKLAGKETIGVPASAMVSRTTNGAAPGATEMSTNKNMFVTKDFDASTQEFVQFEVPFPKSWDLGTVTFQPIWSHPATATNFGVVWGLAGVTRSDDDAGDVAFGTAQTSTDTGGTTNDIYVGPESSAITIAGTPAAGDTVQFQLNRTVADGSDTLAVDARLHGIKLFFTTNAADDT